MPRKNHLSRGHLHELRAALEAKRAELLREHEENLSAGTHTEEVASDPMEAAERATEEAELLSLPSQEGTLLSEVDRALPRMGHATYRVGDLNGSPIPP